MKKVITAFLLVGFCISLYSESNYACIPHINNIRIKSIYGRVSFAKNKNEIYPNASVKILQQYKLKDQDGEFETKYRALTETKTNKKGYFNFPNLQKGIYAIVIETENFKKFWHLVKLTRSDYKKRLKKELVIYLSLPFDCDEIAEVHKIKKL